VINVRLRLSQLRLQHLNIFVRLEAHMSTSIDQAHLGMNSSGTSHSLDW
jgi:hypothetical protein